MRGPTLTLPAVTMPGRFDHAAASNSHIAMMSVGEDYLATSYKQHDEIASHPSVSERLYQV